MDFEFDGEENFEKDFFEFDSFEFDGDANGFLDPILKPISTGFNFAVSTIKEEVSKNVDKEASGVGWSTKTKAECDLENWQSFLKQDSPLKGLFIPGTHDSCSNKTILESLQSQSAFASVALSPFSSMLNQSATQTLSIEEQLISGIRAFDLRIGPSLVIYHGAIKMGYSLKSILTTMINFLDNHPTEFFFFRIKADSGLAQNDLDNLKKLIYDTPLGFESRKPIDYFMIAESDTKVYQVKGKMVLYDRGNIKAIPFFNSFGGDFDVQDEYNVDPSKKIGILQKNLLSPLGSLIALNYSSAYSENAWPFTMAQKVNESLMKLFIAQKTLAPSIIMMDFPSNELIELIRNRNDDNALVHLFLNQSKNGEGQLENKLLEVDLSGKLSTLPPPPAPFFLPETAKQAYEKESQGLGLWRKSDLGEDGELLLHLSTQHFLSANAPLANTSFDDSKCYCKIDYEDGSLPDSSSYKNLLPSEGEVQARQLVLITSNKDNNKCLNSESLTFQSMDKKEDFLWLMFSVKME